MDNQRYGRRVALGLLLLGLAVLIGAVAWTMTRLLMLVLLAAVFATFFHGAAARLQNWRGWDYRLCFGLVMAGFVAVLGGIAGAVGPSLAGQIEELRSTLPGAFGDLQGRISSTPLGQRFVDALPTFESLSKSGFSQISGTSRWLGGALDAVSGVVFCVALAVFLMLDPASYRRGIVRLVPMDGRERAERILDDLGSQLHEWTRARFVAMLFVAVFDAVGLWIAGVPMPLALGAIAGLLTFVPFVGPIVAAVPGLALALTEGPVTAGAALGVYVGAQMLEGYLVTPWLQQQMAELPPALLVLGQFFFGAVAGISGLVVAGPATLVVRTLVRKVYVEDVLGDAPSGEGEDGEASGDRRRKGHDGPKDASEGDGAGSSSEAA